MKRSLLQSCGKLKVVGNRNCCVSCIISCEQIEVGRFFRCTGENAKFKKFPLTTFHAVVNLVAITLAVIVVRFSHQFIWHVHIRGHADKHFLVLTTRKWCPNFTFALLENLVRDQDQREFVSQVKGT